VLSGEAEGRLAYRGSCVDLPDGVGSPRLVVDIGGGSTEFVLGDSEARAAVSIDVGCIRLTERELRADPPRPAELSNAIGHVQDHLDDVLRDMPAILDVASIVGIGGTISTVAAVEIGLMDVSALHGFWLSRDAAEDVFRTLATERLADRLHNPGLPPDRAPIIVGGLCVLVAVLRKLKADGLTVSQRNAVDGICSMLLEGTWPGRGAPS
jgi:exopolyphosphatase/guanosine-5'-triphosphate,3'-diphosphate pyrophosphatase